MWRVRSTSVRSVSSEVLQELDHGLSLADADGAAEDLEDQVRAHLDGYLSDCAHRGVVSSFVWSTVDRRRLVAYSDYSRTLPQQVREAVPIAPELRRAIATTISADDFERLCAQFLGLLGCTFFKKTVASHDGGVDFVGQAPFDANPDPYPTLPRARTLGREGFVVLGQAKRIPVDRAVGVEPIRAFYGSALIAMRMAEAERPVTRTDRLLREMDYRAARPTVLLFATTGDFTSDARELARRLAIIELDGEQLSQTLAIAGVGMERTPNGLAYNAARLTAWISGEGP
jgi:hypothetical protein